jgi:cysteinyl-tRNA synthetase
MTSLKLYNTLTRRKDDFVPQSPDRVTFYACGPTVYNFIHVGNARPAVVFDVLFRVLRSLYPRVDYVRNITDVDDKINRAAMEEGVDIRTFTDRYIAAYHQDVRALNTLEPSVEPRATEHIRPIIAMIGKLMAGGHAYEADGHVLFSLASMPDYGRLSGRTLEDLLAGARVEVASYKAKPGDFVLWKPSTPDLPGWDSPWGRGRPGWHIECSAMNEQHLGETIDIHGGGQDLIFPHHENEIAQSQCAHGGKPFCNYWVHNGYITVDNAKMSKSEGNFFTLREVLATYPGEVIRLALLTAQYRQPLNWSEDLLTQARANLNRLYQALRNAGVKEAFDDRAAVQPADVDTVLLEALLDDLNTPLALTRLHELAQQLNKASEESRPALTARLRASAGLMGLLAQSPEDWFRAGSKDSAGLSDADIESLIRQRAEAKSQRDFTRADAVRDELKQAGIALEDTPAGTRWTRQ